MHKHCSTNETRIDGIPALFGAVLTSFLVGCQSYEAIPLDPAGHREAWHARTLEESSLQIFLRRLDGDLGDAGGTFDATDGVDLREGRLIALVFNPDLRLERLRMGQSAANARHASDWKDPAFAASVLRVNEDVPDRWIITPSLTISIPLSGRIAAEQDLADATLRAARHRVLEAEWTVWHGVRVAWIAWSAAVVRLTETERLVDSLDTLVVTTAQLADRGELSSTEASLSAVEQAHHRSRVRRLRGDVSAKEQRLRAQLGLAPEAPVEFLVSLEFPANDEAGAGASAIAARNPSLARLQEQYEVAEETLRLEIKKQIPDLTLGPVFEADEGRSKVGFIGGIPIPLLNANRKNIARAKATRELARAAFETEYESLVGRWTAADAWARSLRAQRDEMEDILVPLVDRQLTDAMALMKLGEGTGLVLESLIRTHTTKLELLEARAAEALARAELEYLTGPSPQGQPGLPMEEAR